MDKRALAQNVWEAILKSYNQDDETVARITLPIGDVVDVLYSLAANVISQVPDVNDRTAIAGRATPMIDKLVRRIRNQPGLYIPRGIKSLDQKNPLDLLN